MADQVAAVCRSGYYQLRQLRSVVRSLSVHGAEAVVHAFIACLLDYYNSLLTGVNDGLLQRLQSVQDAAARLVTSMQRCEHITPVLRQLHWLSVRQRIHYNLATLVFPALSVGPGLRRRRRTIYLSQIHIYIKLQTNTC